MRKIVSVLVMIMAMNPSITIGSVTFKDAQRVYLKLTQVNPCFFKCPKLTYNPSLNIGAYTNIFRIQIYQGMLNFLQNDDELAIVLGHELAHYKNHSFYSSTQDELAADKYGYSYATKSGYKGCKGARTLIRLNEPAGGIYPSSVSRYRALGCGR